MDSGWALILSAVVTAVGGIIVAVIAQFRKENKRDHDVVTGLLKILYNKVNKLDGKVDEHIDWHRKVDSSK